MPKFSHNELENIKQAYHTGRELADAGMLEDAIQYFDKVLRMLPRRRRDRVYRIEKAAPLLAGAEGVLWLPPVFRDALLAKAFCLNELGRLDDAFVLLQRAVELDPENPQVYAELGFTLSSQDNLALAHSAYECAAELEPNNPAHQRALARLALVEERFEEARDLSLRVLELDATSIHALQHLALAEYRLGNLEKAILALERARALAPADAESVRRLASVLHEAGRIRKAIDCVNEYLLANPLDTDVLGLMTDLLQQDGKAPELIPHAERLLARNPRDIAALDLLAWGYYQQGRLEAARDTLRRLVNLDPEQPYHHFKLGVMYQAMGQLPNAMAAFLRAVAMGQGSDLEAMATEAISVLDQVQIEQLIARARLDSDFRHRLQLEPELTLHHCGVILSPLGFVMLQAFDFGEERDVPDVGSRIVN